MARLCNFSVAITAGCPNALWMRRKSCSVSNMYAVSSGSNCRRAYSCPY